MFTNMFYCEQPLMYKVESDVMATLNFCSYTDNGKNRTMTIGGWETTLLKWYKYNFVAVRLSSGMLVVPGSWSVCSLCLGINIRR